MKNRSHFRADGHRFHNAGFDGHEVLSRLSSRYGVRLRAGELRLCCPAHGGSNRTSLSLSVSPAGTLLAHCHSAGCSFAEIAAAIEAETGVRLTAPRRAEVPDPRTGGRASGNFVEHRYEYRRGSDRVTQVDRRYSGPCGREGCAEVSPHKHEWREPGGMGGTGFELLLHEPESRVGASVPVLAEGEKTCAAVAAVGYPAYSYLGGAPGADKADYSALAGTPLVLVAPDNDRPGVSAALESAAALLSLSPPVAAVRVLDATLLPRFRGSDLADVEPGRRLELLRGLASGEFGQEYRSRALALFRLAEAGYSGRAARLPESLLKAVEVSKDTELLEFSEGVWRALINGLCAPGKERLFLRGGKELVEIGVREGKQCRDGRPENTVYILPVGASRLGTLFCEAVWWHRPKVGFAPLCAGVEGDGEEFLLEAAEALRRAEARPHSWPGWKDSLQGKGSQYGIWFLDPRWPTKEGLEYLLASVPADVPPLKRVLHAPVLSPDRSRLLAEPGYHREVAAWIAEDGGLSGGGLPGPAECLARLDEVFGQFPFATDTDRANLLALLLAGVVGPASGPKPAFLGDKPSPGTGATLMMRTAALLVGGVEPPWLTARNGKESSSDAELERGLVTAALSGNPFVFLDNATGRLNSPVLNAYLSAEE